jgi:CRP-like cAMP-binding protein
MRLGPGDHYGEMGILTGSAAGVRIVALTPAVVNSLAKADLAPILATRPQVAEEMCRIVAQREATRRSVATEDTADEANRSLTARLAAGLHRLFEHGAG